MKLKRSRIQREQQCSLQVHLGLISAVLQRKNCICCFLREEKRTEEAERIPQSHRCDRLEKNAAVATMKQGQQFVWEF